MPIDMSQALRQRADYTHKFNVGSGRHGWLRLTPAYSVRVVEEIIRAEASKSRVLDPFCGTGTTALTAVTNGFDSATADINPFLVWLAQAKVASYSKVDLDRTKKLASKVVSGRQQSDLLPPPIHNIERWWSQPTVDFLLATRKRIEDLSELNSPEQNLLLIAFCRTLIKLSNAAFNHQSMSFKAPAPELELGVNYASVFLNDVEAVLHSAPEPVTASCDVLLQDARTLTPDKVGTFDLVVTSPPYVNRMSYIRELRPYMYWLGYLNEARDAGELDWQAIGGTWGIATSRLSDWKADTPNTNCTVELATRSIATAENKHAKLLATYVEKYFVDMRQHFIALSTVMRPGGRVHYIVGNSTFYGTLVSAEEIYADFMKEVGFSDVKVTAIRKRNSKKELIEFDVSATWNK
ncbi:DNA adenine methylase [Hyphomonas sp. NPDC076900]|uniref:DNA adenine methylase n=1 Tax=unclassified Hyphomonas TaxID=2630699 RepID=UPI003CFE2B44